MKSVVCILTVLATLLCSFAQARKVSGYVFVDKNENGIKDRAEQGVKGVCVSDQVQVVQTDADGMYTLSDTQGLGFIFISLPSGYASATRWWSKVPEGDEPKINFPLLIASTTTSFSFIHASDTHISEKSLQRMQRLREIVDANKPSFVLVSGDLVKDALRVSEKESTGYFELYLKEIQKFQVPVWSVPGNHEIFGIERHLSLVSKDHPLYGKKMYHHYLGPNYYSFNYGGIHFVGLDDVDFEDLWYYGHVDSTQVNWLKRDLAAVALTTPVITFNHIPFFSGALSTSEFTESGPARTLEREGGILQFRHVVSNATEIVDILREHAYPIALSGHNHFRQVFWMETQGQKTRYEQAAAVVEELRTGNQIMPSGVTLYTVKDGKIDEGRFIRMD
jgi:predicted MPP superfamily phosphohydrolase